jgi:heme a synthase
VVLGWPLLAAVLHTGGAGAMLAVLVWMLAITQTTTVAAFAPDYSRRLTP